MSEVRKFIEIIRDVAYKLGLIADYPIETGVDGIWAYRKWANGKIDFWNEGYETVIANASGSSSIGYDFLAYIPIPKCVLSVENVSGAIHSGVGWGCLTGWGDAQVSAGTIIVRTSGHYQSTEVRFALKIIGNWKKVGGGST